MNFVNGVAEKGAVRVPALSEAVIPTSVALPAEGAAVTVGIRPQDMELTAEASPIQLDIRERLGGVAYDYLNTATGERLVVESRGDLAMEEGTEVTVNFDKDRAMFFDAKTEARLR
jgi:lactose/L-arabinose transport system ATP-binding protein